MYVVNLYYNGNRDGYTFHLGCFPSFGLAWLAATNKMEEKRRQGEIVNATFYKS